jgi:hypothetical protein
VSDPASPPPSARTGDGGPLRPVDLELLAGLGRANDWTKSLLCSLARRGTWLRRSDPDRAEALLAAIAAWPWYKGGQFLFDLLEWEDFMTDGPPPPDFAGEIDNAALKRLARLLRQVAVQIDATLPEWAGDAVGSPGPEAVPLTAELPPLEPGFHLYRDVVLGVLLSNATGPTPGSSAPGAPAPGAAGGS